MPLGTAPGKTGLFRRLRHRVVRMRGAVGGIAGRPAGARIGLALREGPHGDAVLHRADVDAEVAGDAFGVVHLEDTALLHPDRLVARILAGGVAAAALDAEVLVDLG